MMKPLYVCLCALLTVQWIHWCSLRALYMSSSCNMNLNILFCYQFSARALHIYIRRYSIFICTHQSHKEWLGKIIAYMCVPQHSYHTATTTHYIGTVQILFRFNFLPSVADHRCERKKKIYSFFPQNIASSLLSAMDRTHDPCKDFFQYACGTWNKKHVIPEDRSSISTFEVRVCLLNKLKKIENHYAAIRCWPINNRPF